MGGLKCRESTDYVKIVYEEMYDVKMRNRNTLSRINCSCSAFNNHKSEVLKPLLSSTGNISLQWLLIKQRVQEKEIRVRLLWLGSLGNSWA